MIYVASWAVFFLGLWSGSFPNHDADETGFYAWMNQITPPWFNPPSKMWTGLGAVMIIWSIRKLPLMLKIHTSPLIKYLGKISFSFYVVHFWILCSAGTVVFYAMWGLSGKDGLAATYFGFILSYVVSIALAIWVADIFWRCIEKPSVTLQKTLEERFFTPENQFPKDVPELS